MKSSALTVKSQFRELKHSQSTENQMRNASDSLRRALPLSVKDVGFISGQGVTAWANWDRLVVRTEQNQVLLDFETHNCLLHSQMEFVDNRYLVVPFGTGTMVTGFKAFDFQSCQWTIDVAFGTSNEVGFLGAHPAAPVIAIEDENGLELWDLPTGSRFSLVPISDSPNVAALGGPDDKIAIGTWEKITVIDQGRETLSVRVCTGDVDALAWNVSKASLLFADVKGNLMQVDPKSAQVTHLFGRVTGGIKKIRVSPDGKSAIAIGYEGQAFFVDCESTLVVQQEDIFDAAFSTVDADCIVVAGLAGMRRIKLSNLSVNCVKEGVPPHAGK